MMLTKVNIIIAEDHKLMRRGYRDVLKEQKNYTILAEAENGKELMTVLATAKPDLILLDLQMPLMSGGEAFAAYHQLYPDIKTIVISNHYEDNLVTEYFLKGVNGYLPKNCEPDQLIEAIEQVMTEGFYYTKALSRILLSKLLSDQKLERDLETLRLTPVELDILKLICEEKTARKIAEQLRLTVYSVENHRRNIQQKTGKSSAIGLFKFAVKHGIVDLDE